MAEENGKRVPDEDRAAPVSVLKPLPKNIRCCEFCGALFRPTEQQPRRCDWCVATGGTLPTL